MIQSQNSQSESERQQSKSKGRFTGERLKVLRPGTYRQALELLAEPREQVPYDHICRLLHVSEHTLKAIEARESLSIAERKQRLLDKALRVASKAIDRVEDQIDDANITQATVAFGVATEKAQLLSGDMTARIEHVPAQQGNIFEAFQRFHNQVMAEIQAKLAKSPQLVTGQLALPDSHPVADPGC